VQYKMQRKTSIRKENRHDKWEFKQKKRKAVIKSLKRNWLLYVFIFPTLLYLIIFNYWPLYGIQIAFRNYTFAGGFNGSKWVGLKWFERFLSGPNFKVLLKNTLILSLYSFIVGFPWPILFAVFLNNVGNLKFKKFAQTITYMPHFLSATVLVGMMTMFFSPSSGFVNTILGYLGGSDNTYFMGSEKYFRHMYVWSGIWAGMGWNSIIYLAALSGVDQSLHEAARIDGANKLQRVWHIDLPSIKPTIVILLIMGCGNIIGVGFEKVYLMQNDLNVGVSEVISTYVYKVGIGNRQYSYSTAIGLMNNIVNFVLLTIANKASRKLGETSLW